MLPANALEWHVPQRELRLLDTFRGANVADPVIGQNEPVKGRVDH